MGGGIIRNSIFSSNFATTHGGALFLNTSGYVLIENSVFYNNISTGDYDQDGGVLFAHGSAIVDVNNCTFVNNGGNYGNFSITHAAEINFNNSIIWGPSTNSIHFWSSNNNVDPTANISYSNIEGGQTSINNTTGIVEWGVGNIDADPQFSDSVF